MSDNTLYITIEGNDYGAYIDNFNKNRFVSLDEAEEQFYNAEEFATLFRIDKDGLQPIKINDEGEVRIL